MADTPTHRRMTIADVRLHYRVAGRGRGGIPVVCLAAPGDSSGSMIPLVRRLGETRLAFALDLPGHGSSGNPPYGRRDPSWWLLAWLERMRFEHCHLVTAGGSVGVAIDAVQRSQKFVRSLAVIAPPALHRRGRLREASCALLGAAHAPRSVRLLTSLAARARSQVATDFRRAMYPRDLERELRFVTMPLIVVRGEHDAATSHDEAAALARKAHGTFIELPDAPRSCHLTHADPIAGTFERFWASLDGDNAARPGARARAMSMPRGAMLDNSGRRQS